MTHVHTHNHCTNSLEREFFKGPQRAISLLLLKIDNNIDTQPPRSTLMTLNGLKIKTLLYERTTDISKCYVKIIPPFCGQREEPATMKFL